MEWCNLNIKLLHVIRCAEVQAGLNTLKLRLRKTVLLTERPVSTQGGI